MKTIKASDCMTTRVLTIREEAPLLEALKLIVESAISGLPVVNAAGELVGIISEHDIMNFALSGTAQDTSVKEAMTRQVIAFEPETELEIIVNACVQHRIRRVPIVKGRKVVGIVSRRDVLRELHAMYRRVS